MAALVSSLASGVSAAPSGTAEFFVQGTSTLSAKVYSDPNGTTAETSHPLDEDGSVIRYVTEPVDVIVRDSTGAQKRAFTEMGDARLIRVESPGFTGPNAVGQTVAGGRTTLQDDLGLLYQSFGDTNGYVSVSGTSQLIKNAISTTTGIFLNVKTVYGAKGDGVNDDTSAIQQAVNAAVAAGGGVVFFPFGNYRISGSISTSSSDTVAVSFVGVAQNCVTITQVTDAVTGWLNAQCFVSLENISFTGAVSAGTILKTLHGSTVTSCNFNAYSFGGTLLDINCDTLGYSSLYGAPGNAFINCSFIFGSSAATNGIFAKRTTGQDRVQGSFFACGFKTQSTHVNNWFDGFKGLSFNSCDFYATSTNAIVGPQLTGTYSFSGCRFNAQAASGTLTINNGAFVTLSGCYLFASGGITLSAASLSGSGSTFESAGWYVASGGSSITFGSPLGGYSSTRDHAMLPSSVAGTTFTPSIDYGTHEVTHTSGASMAFANTAVVPSGWEMTIIYKNSTGGSITPTWGTAYSGVPATAVGNGSTACYKFSRSTSAISSGEWILVTTSPVVAAS